MTDKQDISRIDFSKCKLPNWRNYQMVAIIPSGCKMVHIKPMRGFFAGATVAALETGERWVFCDLDNSSWGDVELLKAITDQVDAFIASELARLATEDEAKNWVDVPWQDVEWLTGKGCKVQFRNVDHGYDWGPRNGDACHLNEYRADRRTLPTGYDPEKPRWVEVEFADSERLMSLGCNRAIATCGRDWREDIAWAPGALCAIDIHTVPPGVPLHVEPPKHAPDTTNPIRAYDAKTKDEKKWRPCSREFALAHPGDSEFRVRVDDGHQWSWTYWEPVRKLSSKSGDWWIEFQTTAPATKSLTPHEFLTRLMAGGIIKATRHGKTHWYSYDATEGLKKYATADMCGPTNVDLPNLFRGGNVEVEEP